MFSRAFQSVVLLALLFTSVLAKTVRYDFNVSWVDANPDGHTSRKVVGINGKFPLPTIECELGDQVLVYMTNSLGNYNASIHFHGLFQNGTTAMDGPPGLTQCPVPNGFTFLYNFTAQQTGTYWYHSHVDSQYPDGYRAPLIIREKNSTDYPFDFDEEKTITMSDWYHELTELIDPSFMTVYNPTGAEPIPDFFLFNETASRQNITMEKGKTYYFRVMNIGAFVAQYIRFEGHTVKVVEIDGVYVEPVEVEWLYVAVAQRYGLLIEALNETDKNYAISTIADQDLLDTIPSDLLLNHTNWLEYDHSAAHPEANLTGIEVSDDITPFDDSTLVPVDGEKIFENPSKEIEINVTMNNLNNGINYAFFNNITYTAPKVPALYTVKSAGDLADDPIIYGTNTHSFILEHNEVIQITLNNQDSGSHPFHLHGHTFQVVYRSPAYDDDDITAFDWSNKTLTDSFPSVPARRDTLVAHPNGNFVIRFRSDNPGIWFFHCHIEWHLHQGLALVLIEAPMEIQNQTIPQNHYDACSAVGMAYKGNAAANVDDFTDLTGQNVQVKDLPAGFTARGIVALVFSVIAAFLGMASLTWYGLSDLSLTETRMIQRAEVDAGMEPESINPDDVSAHNEER